MTLVTHSLKGQIEEISKNTRSNLLTVIDGLDCGNFDVYVGYSDAFETVVQGSLLASGLDDKKMAVLSFCEANNINEDDTCLVQEIRDPFEVQIIVKNVDGGINNQFNCWTSGGGGGGNLLIQYQSNQWRNI